MRLTPKQTRRPPGGATPGEIWTSEELLRLRAGGYRPDAWVGFLRAARERAADTGAGRPELRAQLDVGVVAWLALAAASRRVPVARLVPAVAPASELAWAGSVWLMLRWHLGMVEGPAGEHRRRLSAADAASVARVWLAPRLLRVGAQRRAFLALIALAAATDVLDGALARRSGPTRLGRDLDRIADACVWSAAGLAARREGWLGRQAVAALCARYGAGLAFALARYFVAGEQPAGGTSPAARALGSASVVALAATAVDRSGRASQALAGLSLAALGASTASELAARG